MMAECGIAVDASQAEGLADEGKTVTYFACDGKLVGIIAVADVPKATSAAAIAQLRAMGIRTVMLTGDAERTALAVQRQVGTDEVIAGVLPAEKERIVRQLSAKAPVAMVGDGINDAPALARADAVSYTHLHELPTPASAERIVVVDFSRNFGKESALLAGLQHAEGDAVGLMDADLQQPPATLLEMYRMLQANPSADCVAAFQEHRNEGAVLSFFKHAF